MDLSQLIPLVASLASAVAAILAWVAKIRWSDEYSRAKDETIKAKDTLIEVKDAQLQTLITNKDEIIKAKEEQIKVLEREVHSLNELTPMKIREYFLSVREQMEEYNTLLQAQLEAAHKELSLRKIEIAELLEKGEKSASEIEKLDKERQSIAEAAATLENQLSELQQKFENQKEILVRMPKIDVNIEGISESLKILAAAMPTNYTKDIARMSKIMLESSRFALQEQEIMKQLLNYRNMYAHNDPRVFLPAQRKEANLLNDTNDDAVEERNEEDSKEDEPGDDTDPIAA